MHVPLNRITSEDVKSLEPNEIFVFGSNRAGRHGAGAAKTAWKKFGAIYGVGEGIQGQSYGISTKDKNLNVLSLHEITINVERFIRYASDHPENRFLCTAIGTGLSKYGAKDIAPMFEDVKRMVNVTLPISFWRVLYGDIP